MKFGREAAVAATAAIGLFSAGHIQNAGAFEMEGKVQAAELSYLNGEDKKVEGVLQPAASSLAKLIIRNQALARKEDISATTGYKELVMTGWKSNGRLDNHYSVIASMPTDTDGKMLPEDIYVLDIVRNVFDFTVPGVAPANQKECFIGNFRNRQGMREWYGFNVNMVKKAHERRPAVHRIDTAEEAPRRYGKNREANAKKIAACGKKLLDEALEAILADHK